MEEYREGGKNIVKDGRVYGRMEEDREGWKGIGKDGRL